MHTFKNAINTIEGVCLLNKSLKFGGQGSCVREELEIDIIFHRSLGRTMYPVTCISKEELGACAGEIKLGIT